MTQIVSSQRNLQLELDERTLVRLGLALTEEAKELQNYRWFNDTNHQQAIALGRKAKLAASTGAACDWESFAMKF